MAKSKRKKIILLPRKIKFTREGKYFVFITLGIGFAAVNTGNNLLHLLLGMLLSFIILSGILSERSIKGARVKREDIPEIFAKTPVRIKYEIQNISNVFACYSIGISESFLQKNKKNKKKHTKNINETPAFAYRIKKNSNESAKSEVVFPTRGIFESSGVNVFTEFPFSFFKKIRFFAKPQKFLVYPQLIELDSKKNKNQGKEEEITSGKVGHGFDFYGLRLYRYGDSLKNIAWKQTARLGSLVVKENEDYVGERFYILLVNSSKNRLRAENMISYAATLCDFYTRKGFETGLVTLKSMMSKVTILRNRKEMLSHLALLDIETDTSVAKAMVERFINETSGSWIVITDESGVNN